MKREQALREWNNLKSKFERFKTNQQAIIQQNETNLREQLNQTNQRITTLNNQLESQREKQKKELTRI